MAIIEQSSALAELAEQAPMLKARIAVAEQRLRIAVAGELLAAGLPCGADAIDRVIAGLPDDVRCRLIAERT